MKDEDDVKSGKFLSRDGKGESNEDGMKDDTGFEDEYRRQLRSILAIEPWGTLDRGEGLWVSKFNGVRPILRSPLLDGSFEMGGRGLGQTHGEELDEEDGEHRNHRDSLRPWVFSDRAGEAGVGKSFVRGREELAGC